MKILFVYSVDEILTIGKPLRSWMKIQLGISYISALLKENGHHTDLVVLGSNHWHWSVKLLNKAVKNFDPGLICLSSIQSQYPFIQNIGRHLKSKWPEKYLIIGGVHPTILPEEVIQGPFDALCIGEGEYPTLELCEQLESNIFPHNIKNLWIKSNNNHIEKNDTRDFLQNLDELPLPDREIWNPWIKEQRNDAFTVLLGRGCSYECSYCSHHVLKNVANGRYVRLRSIDLIIEEICLIQKQYPHSRMYFEIESVAINKPWLLELCNQLAKMNQTLKPQISFAGNFRISKETIDENLFAALKKANFSQINIGLESGSERIRRDVLNRFYTNEDFFKVFTYARKQGLKVVIFNMIGLPGESLKEYKETVSVNRQCQPEGHYTQIFYPYKGTVLYNICIEKGLINDGLNIKLERKQSILNLPDFSKSQIKRAYNWFNYYVYKNYIPIWKLGLMVLLVKLRSNTVTNSIITRILHLPIISHLNVKFAGPH